MDTIFSHFNGDLTVRYVFILLFVSTLQLVNIGVTVVAIVSNSSSMELLHIQVFIQGPVFDTGWDKKFRG